MQPCAVQYKTIVSTHNCHRPGIYSEYLHALLSLAHINYTIFPVYINSETNVTWGAYIKDTNWYDGILGQLKDDYDLLLSPYSVTTLENGATLLSWYFPEGNAGLSMVYRRQLFNFWKEASWPLRVFDISLWGVQIGVFLVGAIALSLSRYVVKKFVMYENNRRASLTSFDGKQGAAALTEGLFHYYAVMISGQGDWETVGKVNEGQKIRSHMQILYVILGLAVIFGSFLYEGLK